MLLNNGVHIECFQLWGYKDRPWCDCVCYHMAWKDMCHTYNNYWIILCNSKTISQSEICIVPIREAREMEQSKFLQSFFLLLSHLVIKSKFHLVIWCLLSYNDSPDFHHVINSTITRLENKCVILLYVTNIERLVYCLCHCKTI